MTESAWRAEQKGPQSELEADRTEDTTALRRRPLESAAVALPAAPCHKCGCWHRSNPSLVIGVEGHRKPAVPTGPARGRWHGRASPVLLNNHMLRSHARCRSCAGNGVTNDAANPQSEARLCPIPVVICLRQSDTERKRESHSPHYWRSPPTKSCSAR